MIFIKISHKNQNEKICFLLFISHLFCPTIKLIHIVELANAVDDFKIYYPYVSEKVKTVLKKYHQAKLNS